MPQPETGYKITMGGETLPLLYTIHRFMLAERDLRCGLLPIGSGPFWRRLKAHAALQEWASGDMSEAAPDLAAAGIEITDGAVRWDHSYEFAQLALLYVGVRGLAPYITLDWLANLLTPEKAREVDTVLGDAIGDFFHRLGAQAEATKMDTAIPI